MKLRIIHLALMALTIGVIGTSCTSQEKKTKDLQTLNDSMEHPHNYVDSINTQQQDWEKFKLDAQARISRNQDSINEFKTRIAKGQAKMKAKFNERITLLEEVNTQLKKRVDEYKEEGKDKWDKFKHDFNSDMDSLNTHMKEVFADDRK